MSKGQLSARERRLYIEGGFRLEGTPRTANEAECDSLGAAAQLLKLWGADAAAVRATLAAPSAYQLRRWQRGEAPIPLATQERIAVVLALYRLCFEAGDVVNIRPLPALHRPGRKPLSGRAVLAAGRLGDLLALWRQLALAEEACGRREQRRSARARRAAGRAAR